MPRGQLHSQEPRTRANRDSQPGTGGVSVWAHLTLVWVQLCLLLDGCVFLGKSPHLSESQRPHL